MIDQSVIDYLKHSSNISTSPLLDYNQSVEMVARLLEQLWLHRWEKSLSFPSFLIQSTIARDSTYIEYSEDQKFIVHDAGLIDIAASIADSVTRHHLTPGPSAYVFVIEQMLRNDRIGLALIAHRIFCPSEERADPIIAKPDGEIRSFVSKLCSLELNLPSRAFMSVAKYSHADQAARIAEAVFLGHELGHYVYKNEYGKNILRKLKITSSEKPGNSEEIECDALGLAFTMASLYRTVSFREPGSATWLAGRAILLLKINESLSRVRNFIEKSLAQSGASAFSLPITLPEPRRESLWLAQDNVLKNIFRWSGIRAKIIPATIDHFNECADIVTRSFESIVVKILTKVWEFTANHLTDIDEIEKDGEIISPYLLNCVRQGMGRYYISTLSLHSPRHPTLSRAGSYSSPIRRPTWKPVGFDVQYLDFGAIISPTGSVGKGVGVQSSAINLDSMRNERC